MDCQIQRELEVREIESDRRGQRHSSPRPLLVHLCPLLSVSLLLSAELISPPSNSDNGRRTLPHLLVSRCHVLLLLELHEGVSPGTSTGETVRIGRHRQVE